MLAMREEAIEPAFGSTAPTRNRAPGSFPIRRGIAAIPIVVSWSRFSSRRCAVLPAHREFP
jgi:hypothetical protein